jgi:hypothetical protein
MGAVLRVLRVLVVRVLPALVLGVPAIAEARQSPSTSAIVVVVTDQTGAAVNDAKVTVVNTQTRRGA